MYALRVNKIYWFIIYYSVVKKKIILSGLEVLTSHQAYLAYTIPSPPKSHPDTSDAWFLLFIYLANFSSHNKSKLMFVSALNTKLFETQQKQKTKTKYGGQKMTASQVW